VAATGAGVATHVSRWVDSQPQLAIGHLAHMDRLADLLASHRGLELAGNYVNGVGIPLCIQSGERASERMRQYLRDMA
jgi:oxygen-dependent protoporphyrinogen oxidase